MSILIFIFIYTVATYGIASALVYFNGPFEIIDRFRNWIGGVHDTFEQLFSCMFCLPTNIGIILSIISCLQAPGAYFTPFTLMLPVTCYTWPVIVLFDAFYTGATAYIIDKIASSNE